MPAAPPGRILPHATPRPRRPRRPLERPAPQDRHLRLAGLRRHRVRPRRRDRHQDARRRGHGQRLLAASPTRPSPRPTSPTRPTSRCSCRPAAARSEPATPRSRPRSTTSSRASKRAQRTSTDVESPLAKGNEGQISKDGRSALVTFSIPGDDDVADKRVDATLAATAAAQKAHPELRIEQFGDASADKALGDVLRRRLQDAPSSSRCRSRC